MNKPLAQDYTIIWHDSDDRFYFDGCGLANLGGGDWLAVVPHVPRSGEKDLRAQLPTQSRIHIIRSNDGDASWNKVSELPYYSAVPFLHNGAVYLFANTGVEDNGQKVRLSFTQYHPMPCGNRKFCVIWDKASGLFWATTNPSVNSQELVDWSGMRVKNKGYKGGYRRFLMLYYSLDGLNWMQAGCVAQAARLWQSFSYPALTVDGQDLGIIARSNINGPNPHDADGATFHRVKNFRELAMNLHPERD